MSGAFYDGTLFWCFVFFPVFRALCLDPCVYGLIFGFYV